MATDRVVRLDLGSETHRAGRRARLAVWCWEHGLRQANNALIAAMARLGYAPASPAGAPYESCAAYEQATGRTCGFDAPAGSTATHQHFRPRPRTRPRLLDWERTP
ncbi:hypothetical protein DY218_27360 [Streptomyces triticagri]|uniref:Uncharacterized protein n=1 Tax=Streptomyces triticagri TaxID=2293568 RepID=A0A372LY71_9ACTN|nr:hypothetical protein [Streptomyces triticagri]RFU83628.1 hypothetical protein DY218_27360 [Streptomyces triticagri]